jgi:hypothetical protein
VQGYAESENYYANFNIHPPYILTAYQTGIKDSDMSWQKVKLEKNYLLLVPFFI